MISSLSSFILSLNCGLWFLNLKNSSLIICNSFAAASNFKPLLVSGTKGTSIVFSIDPVPDWTFIIPQSPCSLTALSLSLASCSVSKGYSGFLKFSVNKLILPVMSSILNFVSFSIKSSLVNKGISWIVLLINSVSSVFCCKFRSSENLISFIIRKVLVLRCF